VKVEDQRLEIGEVRMSLAGGKLAPDRSARISRLTFDHLQRLMDSRLRDLSESVDLNYLGVAPIQVRFDVMDDETIAQESAIQIYRALLQAL
jgi:hypothetical protein